MALKIVWTQEAENQLDETIKYLESNWSNDEINNFFNLLEEAIQTITKAPTRHKKSIRRSGTHEFQLTPHNTIFYSFNSKEVTVLLFWSNRQDPNNIKD